MLALAKGTQYSDAQFPTKEDGFILATHGTSVLLTTSNGGRTWTTRSIPSGHASWFQFVNPSDGWLVDSPRCLCGSVYRTVDGGATWRRILGLGKVGASQVQFVSPTRGWLHYGGNYGQTVETANGGETWRRAHWPFRQYFQWQFQNSRLGWALTTVGRGLSRLYLTQNGGRRWTKRPSRPGNYGLPDFASDKVGWMIVSTRTQINLEICNQCPAPVALLKSVNGGRSWFVQHGADTGIVNPGRPPHGPYWMGGWAWGVGTPQFVDPQHGWLVFGGWNGRASPPLHMHVGGGVTTTANGGRTWSLHRLNISASAGVWLAPDSATDAWLAVDNNDEQAGTSFVLHTTDEGRHWKPVNIRIAGSSPSA